MKLGQTSVVYFASRILASALGFAATVYFARLLGAGPLGTYYLVVGLVAWLGIAGRLGFSGALTKRISEGEERPQFFIAGTTLVAGLFLIVAAGLLVARPYVTDYVGYPATEYVIAILFVTLAYSLVNALLNGLHLVHVTGPLSTVKTGARALGQIGALVAGLGLVGLFVGHIAGFGLAILIGAAFATRRLDGVALPEKRHFRNLFDYAKYAWIGGLQSRMFNYTDILVLGFFVPSALIGIYSVAWNIGQFLILFAGSISTTLFPEISTLSSDDDMDAVANLVEDALSYAGLLLIPGLIGGAILGTRILRIYGDEFTQGATVLVVLLIANLLMSYQNQVLSTLGAIDRPDLSFRANMLFVVANVTLNVVLVYLYGWLGAAVATALSVSFSLAVGYYYLGALVDISLPSGEIGRQFVAALLMGGAVYAGLWIENTYRLLGHNILTVVLLVGLGAGTYFLVLLAISDHFRTTVDRNLPFDAPLLAGK
jgi:O-antigen/teichoic acid export membrane protein